MLPLAQSILRDLSMELYLQFGYGMMEHCRFLVRHWGEATVILSPRDLSDEQLKRLASEIGEREGSVLLDPQLYAPDATHPRLIKQAFWPRDPTFWTGDELRRVIGELGTLNNSLGAQILLLPGTLAATADDDW